MCVNVCEQGGEEGPGGACVMCVNVCVDYYSETKIKGERMALEVRAWCV